MRDRTPPAEAPTVWRGVLLTDLDGTLLDPENYRPSADALVALRVLDENDIAVVPVSSKTAAEVVPLMGELGLVGPAVTEGGAILVTGNGRTVVRGISRSQLVDILRTLRVSGWPVLGMSEMTIAEIVERTGLAPEAAQRATDRSASEPFVFTKDIGESNEELFVTEVVHRGAEVTRGGRFWHLLGPGIDKRTGILAVLSDIELADRSRTAAVGDAWNDLPMLAEVATGYLLGSAVKPALVPPGVTRIETAGPQGFSEAVSRLLEIWT